MSLRRLLLLLFSFVCFLGAPPAAQAQKVRPQAGGDVFVDAHGVLRWQKDRQEVALFGVNYPTPFAYGYRAHQRRNVNHEQAIRQEVYHPARLGVDAFRVHVWDVEITDTAGNLLENEHLRLLNFLVNELKRRGIRLIFTPLPTGTTATPSPTRAPAFPASAPKPKPV